MDQGVKRQSCVPVGIDKLKTGGYAIHFHIPGTNDPITWVSEQPNAAYAQKAYDLACSLGTLVDVCQAVLSHHDEDCIGKDTWKMLRSALAPMKGEEHG